MKKVIIILSLSFLREYIWVISYQIYNRNVHIDEIFFLHSLKQNNWHVFFISERKIFFLQDMIFWNVEFGKNEHFSITDYSKIVRRRKKIPNNKKLLIVWTFHKNMNKKLLLLLKLQILQMF